MSITFNQQKKMLRYYFKCWKARILKWDDIPKKYQELIEKYYLQDE